MEGEYTNNHHIQESVYTALGQAPGALFAPVSTVELRSASCLTIKKHVAQKVRGKTELCAMKQQNAPLNLIHS